MPRASLPCRPEPLVNGSGLIWRGITSQGAGAGWRLASRSGRDPPFPVARCLGAPAPTEGVRFGAARGRLRLQANLLAICPAACLAGAVVTRRPKALVVGHAFPVSGARRQAARKQGPAWSRRCELLLSEFFTPFCLHNSPAGARDHPTRASLTGNCRKILHLRLVSVIRRRLEF